MYSSLELDGEDLEFRKAGALVPDNIVLAIGETS